MVSKRGCAPALRALYRLSLPSPESLAICAMPRALATSPSAATNTLGFGSSAAAERYSAMTASLSRYAAASNALYVVFLFFIVLPSSIREPFFWLWQCLSSGMLLRPPPAKHRRSIRFACSRPDTPPRHGYAFRKRLRQQVRNRRNFLIRATKASQDSGLCFLVAKIGSPHIEIRRPDKWVHVSSLYPSEYSAGKRNFTRPESPSLRHRENALTLRRECRTGRGPSNCARAGSSTT